MKKVDNDPPAPSLNIGQLYFIFFRHLRLILLFSLLGVVAAAVIFFVTPAVFRSEAKLLVRYVTDTTVLDPSAMGGRTVSPDRYGDNIINSEVQILGSRDLVEEVVDELGIDRFQLQVAKGTERQKAIWTVLRNLHAEVPLRSNVIRIYFDANSPALAQDVLRGLVTHYLRKHIEIHRSAGAYDFLSQQTDQVRARLAETEEELRRIKNDAGIVSVEEAKKSLLARMDELVRELQEAEGTLAASDARMRMLHPFMPAVSNETVTESTEAEDSQGYARVYEKLARLRDREMELQVTFTEDSIPVQNIRAQIDELEKSLGISRNTIRRGLKELIDSGRIQRHVGRGSFVAEAAAPADHEGAPAGEPDLGDRIRGSSPAEVMETRLIVEPHSTASG